MDNKSRHDKMVRKLEEVTNNYVKSIGRVSDEFGLNSPDIVLASLLSLMTSCCSISKESFPEKEVNKKWKIILDSFIRANQLDLYVGVNDDTE